VASPDPPKEFPAMRISAEIFGHQAPLPLSSSDQVPPTFLPDLSLQMCGLRSCRARLNLHNDRRRKRIPDQMTPRQDLLKPEPRARRTRTRRKRVTHGEEADSEEVEAAESEGTSGARGAASGRKASPWNSVCPLLMWVPAVVD